MSLAAHLNDSFSQLRVLIIGDIMIDAYRWGSAERISPEAPVPILLVEKSNERPGGAANVAVNALALGAQVDLVGVCGDDKAGKDLKRMLEKEGISPGGILTVQDRPTTVKTRVIAGSKHLIRVDWESTANLDKNDEQALLKIADQKMKDADILILQDYDKGVFSADGIEHLIKSAAKNDVLVAVDPKKRNFLSFKNADLFKPNFKEMIDGLGIDCEKNETELVKACTLLTEQIRAQNIMLTLSEHGAFYFSGDNSGLIPAHKRNIVDVSGAGDTVITVAALAMRSGQNLELSTELANLAGGLVCEYPGVVAIDKDRFFTEIRELERIN